jgi:purine-nucleoside phosphorylase
VSTKSSNRKDPLVERLADSMRSRGMEGARIAIVLGSGLGGFAERLSRSRTIAYGELEGMPGSCVPGHAGKLVAGEVGGVHVLVQQGRAHLYEDWTASDVTRAVRAFAILGVRAVLLTNAAGGLHRDWQPGTLMRIRDHINLQHETPLGPHEIGSGTPYDVELGRALDRSAAQVDCRWKSGVYAGVPGPSYETPAEIRMLAWMGADAVGMSTVLEALAAHASGMRAAAISCITNLAAGIGDRPPSHEEVLRTGRESAEQFMRLLEESMPEIERCVAN